MGTKRQLMRDSAIRYKKGLGQNFIYDEALLRNLVALTGIGKTTRVLEVGPGMGTLTEMLAETAGYVYAMEIDERLMAPLTDRLSRYPHVRLVNGDFMLADLRTLAAELGDHFSVVANIPYYITTPLIHKLIGMGEAVDMIAVMVQKEVADKMTAHAGSESYGMLAVQCRSFFDVDIAMQVSASSFTPPPKVDSAFVIMRRKAQPIVNRDEEALYLRVAHAAFAMRRKTMVNNMLGAFQIDKAQAEAVLLAAGLDSRIRGEKLSLADFHRIAQLLSPLMI